MKINKISSRGYVFTFSELENTEFNCTTNVYLIDGYKHFFICDTFLGPKYMKKIIKFIEENLESKPIIVFNSHSDWDHIWGNCYFKNNFIISHVRCRENIKKNGQIELKKYSKFHDEDVKIVLPNITFKKGLNFNEDMVEFFYSPGHTECSASCFDEKDNVLFVGDNVESPKPYLTCNNKKDYEETLKKYIKINAEIIIPGHGFITDNDLIVKNLEYIKSV
ncbi:MBL fold metallo-hydrolase [Clostridium massiliodielmoense]|uniref:MBL fold metallo-hydrolase n=1 Tax=Clostridium massiliodielmoense TaxID=1776385 RepID=UPI0004D79F00|nr:MBL fold metallo-hydrolase [Clostridium massiliodielmoense]KEH97733.1 Zn-dependent hydrolase [Clostridium botulinum C/D str. BKT12695]